MNFIAPRVAFSLISLLITSLASSSLAQDEATVTLKRLVEKRELSVEKSPFSGWENGIELMLHVDGPAVVGANKYGKVKITKAMDDAGTDLTKRTGDAPKPYEGFQDVRPAQSFGMNNDKAPKPTGFDFDLKLPATSARGAKAITEVTGELSVLVGGEARTVEVKDLKSALGKPIDDPILKESGITFTLIDPAQRGVKDKLLGGMIGAGDKGLSAVITGDLDLIDTVKIVNPAGESLNNGSFYNDEAGKRSITYMADKPIPADAVMKITVNVGQKTIAVPIELKEVKLP